MEEHVSVQNTLSVKKGAGCTQSYRRSVNFFQDIRSSNRGVVGTRDLGVGAGTGS